MRPFLSIKANEKCLDLQESTLEIFPLILKSLKSMTSSTSKISRAYWKLKIMLNSIIFTQLGMAELGRSTLKPLQDHPHLHLLHLKIIAMPRMLSVREMVTISMDTDFE